MPRRLAIAEITLCFLFFAAAAVARERSAFDDGWKFNRGDTPEAGDLPIAEVRKWLAGSGTQFIATPATQPDGETATPPADWSYASAAFNDAAWRSLRLPHDWAIEGPFIQDLPGETGKRPYAGVAWYRKTFELSAEDAASPVAIDFDGAMSHSLVWINGHFVGGWPYGYTSFRVDLSKYVKAGQNVIAVRLQNPTESSRWYPGAGLYRNVWLVKSAAVRVSQWGVIVTTPEVTDDKAVVRTQVTLKNGLAVAADIATRVEIFEVGNDGSTATAALPSGAWSIQPVGAGGTMAATLDTYILRPKLWSTQSPNRYVARVRLEQGGRVVDEYDQPFGVRTAAFTADDGFHLNGKRVRLNGVCEHHDLGALGTAFNKRAMERKLEILKSMGVNALRTSHNPPAPEVLDLCDRMGIVVIVEAFDGWQSSKTQNDYGGLFADWSERDVRSLVRRDRNHPSVIAWSIGNEVLEQGKVDGATIQQGVPMGKRLSEIFKQEDPTRQTTVAFDHPASGFNDMRTVADVVGMNYKPMLYGKFRAASPGQALVGSETASTISSRGEYFFPVSNKKGDGQANFQMSSYDLYAPGWAMPPDVEFAGQDKNPAVAGEFVWTGFDYLGEPTPYSRDTTNLLNFSDPQEKARMQAQMQELGHIRVPSRSSYFGIIDLAGFPKDRFYLYQARWRPDLPMAHILPHWTWPDRVGQVTPVHVYTSGDEAELFLNGRSLGRKKKEAFAYRLRWDDVVYEPGELKVVAYKDGKPWADAVTRTAGAAAGLTLSADRTIIRADGDDLAFFTLAVTDAAGQPVPLARQRVRFTVDGPGELVATDNGNPIDHDSFQSADRNAFNGFALAIVRAKAGQKGDIVLKAEADGFVAAASIRAD